MIYEFEGEIHDNVKALKWSTVNHGYSYIQSVCLETMGNSSKVIIDFADNVAYTISQKYTHQDLPYIDLSFFKPN